MPFTSEKKLEPPTHDVLFCQMLLQSPKQQALPLWWLTSVTRCSACGTRIKASMEQCCNDTDMGKTKYEDQNLSQCPCVHRESDTD